MRRWAWLASAARASRSAASWRLAASRLGDAGDQLGPVGSFDLGAELEAEAGAELVAFGAEPADLVAGDGQVGAQAGLGGRLAAAWRGRGAGAGLVLGLAAPGGFDVLADAVGVDQPGGHPGGGGDRGRGDRCPGGFEGLDGGQGALAFVVAVFGAGGQHGLGAAVAAVMPCPWRGR